jgi:molecular chaperone DnaK (HSP70)
VPEKYVKRNAELKIKYAVQGYPAFIFLDDDGETVLGQLGASEGQTPEGFIKSLQGFFRYRPAEVAKFTKAFSPADKKAYLKIISQMKDSGQLIEQQKKKIEVARKEIIEVAQKEIMELEKKRVTLQEAAMDFRVSKLEPAKQAVYKELKEKMAGAQKKFEDWIATRPERNEENNQKFKSMNSELQDLAGKLSEF